MEMGKEENKEGNLEEEECGLGGEDEECNMEKGVSFDLQCFFRKMQTRFPNSRDDQGTNHSKLL